MEEVLSLLCHSRLRVFSFIWLGETFDEGKDGLAKAHRHVLLLFELVNVLGDDGFVLSAQVAELVVFNA